MAIDTHLVLHAIQLITTLGILGIFIQRYRETKTRFRLGLIVFAVSVLGQIIFSISLNIGFHLASDVAMIIALLFFIDVVR
jgi:hypothetical protein